MIVGGAGKPRSLRLAVRWATEYNTTRGNPDEIADLRGRIDAACEREGRDPASLPLSLMTTWIVAETRAGVVDYASRLSR